jgi:hypothetical protein
VSRKPVHHNIRLTPGRAAWIAALRLSMSQGASPADSRAVTLSFFAALLLSTDPAAAWAACGHWPLTVDAVTPAHHQYRALELYQIRGNADPQSRPPPVLVCMWGLSSVDTD